MWLLYLATSGALAAETQVSAEGFVQTIEHGVALGAGGRLVQGPGFLSVQARGESHEHWIGRGTIGIDIFSKSKFDLTLGLFAGTVGRHIEPGFALRPTTGFEFGIGTRIGPVSGHYTHAGAFDGFLEDELTENTWRLSWHFADELAVFGQYLRFDPGETGPSSGGVGAGAVLTF